MTYFSKFPLTIYDVNREQSVVRDIFRRARFISEYIPNSDLYTKYTIKDGDTPQSLAKRYYDSTTLHWVILIFNEIHNPLFDWPMDQLTIENLTKQKYGDAAFMTRHYEKNGIVVGEVKEFNKLVTWVPPENPGPQDLNIIPISFYDYEQMLNDEKRVIRIMRPELIGDFVKQFGAYIK